MTRADFFNKGLQRNEEGLCDRRTFFFLKRLGRFKHDYMLLKKRKRERFVE